MALGIFAKKLGMTSIIDENGMPRGVTVLQMPEGVVSDIKTLKKHGYNAVQMCFREIGGKNMAKSEKGFFSKLKLAPHELVREFRCKDASEFTPGQKLTVNAYSIGDIVDLSGKTKGRGFQGVIKRCGKAGGPASHGSHFHRSTGSIGMNTWPGRTIKNMGMPGQMGDVMRTIRGLTVVDIDAEHGLLFVEGAAPGAKNGWVRVICRKEDFAKRLINSGTTKPTGDDNNKSDNESAADEQAA